MPCGDGTHEMMVSKEIQAGAKAAAGDVVKVALKRDDAERQVAMPDELARELRRNKKAAAFFEGLSYSARKEYADWIATAKQVETKASRAAKAVGLFLAGQRRLR